MTVLVTHTRVCVCVDGCVCDCPDRAVGFPQPLEGALKAALKGELEDVVLALLRTPAQYDAQQLKLAMKVWSAHTHGHCRWWQRVKKLH